MHLIRLMLWIVDSVNMILFICEGIHYILLKQEVL